MVLFAIGSVTHGNTSVTVNLTDINNTPNSLGYIIYYSDTTNNTVASQHTFTLATVITGLTNGTSYEFQATKVNSNGLSEDSNVVTATPSTIPSTVTNLSGIMSTVNSVKQIALTWDSNSNNGGDSITSYILHMEQNNNVEITSKIINVSSLTAVSNQYTYEITDADLDVNADILQYGVIYNISLKATNINGDSATYGTVAVVNILAPDAPTNVSASINSTTSTSVDLSWDNYTYETNNGSDIVSFKIVYSNDNTNWLTINTPNNPYTITGLTVPISSYTFKVSATNSTGESLQTSTTIVPNGIPNNVTNLVATNTDLGVTLTWDCVDDDETSPLIGYAVYYKQGSTIHTEYVSQKTIIYSNSGGVNAVTTNFVLGASVIFYVKAINMLGQSATITSTTVVIKSIPFYSSGQITTGILTADGINQDSQIVLTWVTPANDGGSAITGYNIYSGTGTLIISLGDVQTHTVSGLTNGTAYSYKIKAVNAIGTSDFSNIASATPQVVPYANNTLAANGLNQNHQIVLSWTIPTNTSGNAITGYNIYKSSDNLLVANIADPTINTYTVTGLTNGTLYGYYFKSTNTIGESASSNVVTATPLTVVLDTLTLTGDDTDQNGQVVLNWSLDANDSGSAITGYNIYDGTTGTFIVYVPSSALTGIYVKTGLINGTSYTFKIKVINASYALLGNVLSDFSNTITLTPSIPPSWVVPAVTVSSGEDQALTINWNTITENGATTTLKMTFSNYDIVDANNVPIDVSSVTTYHFDNTFAYFNGTSRIVRNITNGSSYFFRIVATNRSGIVYSNMSNAGIPSIDPGVVINQQITKSSLAGTAIVTWAAPTNTGGIAYQYGISINSGTTESYTIIGTEQILSSSTLTYTFSNLTVATPYLIKLYAFNAVNTNVTNTTLLTEFSILDNIDSPSIPTDVQYNYVQTPTVLELHVTWKAPETTGGAIIRYNIALYDKLDALSTDTANLLIQLNDMTELYRVFSGLNMNQNYSIRVYAYVLTSPTDFSETVLLNIPVQTPSVPRDLKFNQSNMTLTWVPPETGTSITYHISTYSIQNPLITDTPYIWENNDMTSTLAYVVMVPNRNSVRIYASNTYGQSDTLVLNLV